MKIPLFVPLPAPFAIPFLAFALAGILGCHQWAPSKPLSELTPQEAAGHRVFVNQCSRCHYANSQEGLTGPGLEGLFRQPYLPSGIAANNQQVLEVIEIGRGMMPGFGNALNQEQLQALMAYLHTL